MKFIYNSILFSLLFVSFCVTGQDTKQQQEDMLLLTGQGSPTLTKGDYFVLEDVGKAFEQMKAAALEDGIEIKIVSGYRSFERQLAIWNRKFEANKKSGLSPKQNIEKIMQYSTIPGTSRHHWGTDIDIIAAYPHVEGDVLLERLFEGEGPYAPLKKWMDKHAAHYGFVLVYTPDKNRTGFKYEPWHYTYAPKSTKMLKDFVTLNLKEILKGNTIFGNTHFSEQFIKQYVNNYVLGIAEALKE